MKWFWSSSIFIVTFLIRGVGNVVHANVIWISKLVPVPGWNAEQALDNLKRKKQIQHFLPTIIIKQKHWRGLPTGLQGQLVNCPQRPSRHFTFGCLLVSFRMVMGSGSGTAWPTRVGPNTLARFLTSILVSMLWETLGGDKDVNNLHRRF